MCSESLPDNTPPAGLDSSQADEVGTASGGSLAKGFYYSILLMLAVPFLLMSGLSGMLYWIIRNSDNNPQIPPPYSPNPPA